jgi:hypothetical protein
MPSQSETISRSGLHDDLGEQPPLTPRSSDMKWIDVKYGSVLFLVGSYRAAPGTLGRRSLQSDPGTRPPEPGSPS